MKIGLVGLPGSGKSTVFGAVTGLAVDTGYAARRDKTNLGVVVVPDGNEVGEVDAQEVRDAGVPSRRIAAVVEVTAVDDGVRTLVPDQGQNGFGVGAAALVGFMLAASGFEPNAAQSPASLMTIRLLICAVPLAFWSLGLLVFARFSLGRSEYARILAAIDARR